MALFQYVAVFMHGFCSTVRFNQVLVLLDAMLLPIFWSVSLVNLVLIG
jgi:hypothetical protein